MLQQQNHQQQQQQQHQQQQQQHRKQGKSVGNAKANGTTKRRNVRPSSLDRDEAYHKRLHEEEARQLKDRERWKQSLLQEEQRRRAEEHEKKKELSPKKEESQRVASAGPRVSLREVIDLADDFLEPTDSKRPRLSPPVMKKKKIIKKKIIEKKVYNEPEREPSYSSLQPLPVPPELALAQREMSPTERADKLKLLLKSYDKNVKKKKKTVTVRLPKRLMEKTLTYFQSSVQSVGIKTRGQAFGVLFHHFLQQSCDVKQWASAVALLYSWPASRLSEFSLHVNPPLTITYRNDYGLYHTYRVFMPAVLWALKYGVPLLHIQPNPALFKRWHHTISL